MIKGGVALILGVCVGLQVVDLVSGNDQEQDDSTEPSKIIRPEDLKNLHEKMIEERAKTIKTMREIIFSCTGVTDVEFVRKLYYAAKVVGEMRAEEALPELCRLLGKRSNPRIGVSANIADTMPAEMALIKIGKPASRAMVDILCRENTDEIQRSSACYVLKEIEDPDVAIFILNKRLKDTTNDNEKENLKKAIKHIENYIDKK